MRFSPNELKMFKRLGLEKTDLASLDDPMETYRLAALNAFMQDQKGPHVDALRRGYNALYSCKAYRHTPEFELLISFEE